jgi:hypothetical protein
MTRSSTLVATVSVPTTKRHTRRLVQGGLLGVAVTALAVGTMGGAAFAAPNGSTSANVAVSSGITLSGLTSSFTLSGAPGATVTGADAVAYNVETNDVAGYTVSIESTTATLHPATAGNVDSISIGHLAVRETGGGAYLPLSNSAAVTVYSQATRSIDGGDNLSNDYQILIPVVTPDTYTATLNYVATAS